MARRLLRRSAIGILFSGFPLACIGGHFDMAQCWLLLAIVLLLLRPADQPSQVGK